MFSDIKIKIKNNRLLTLALIIAFLTTLAFSLSKNNSSTTEKIYPFLSREELAKLAKPAIVRVAQKASGTYVIPEFKIDLKNLKIEIKRDSLRQTEKLEEYLTGSGFIVNPDGYILTNAHVVSPEMIKAFLLSQALEENLQMTLKEIPASGQNTLFENPEQAEKFAQDTLRLLMENSHFEIKSELAVLNPASEKHTIPELFSTGFPAEILDLNENFLYSNKDVALIKINQTHLPSVNLGNPQQAVLGNPIFIFGFPGTAEVNSLNPLEPTLTEGLVSAFKFADNKDFKIIETDAKISQGSSGGPALNQKGEVIGIVTYQTNPVLRAIGDNFGFAIPVDLAKNLLDSQKISAKVSEFNQNAAEAMQLFAAGRCKLANEKFESALRLVNPNFATQNYFYEYTQKCRQNIAEGASLDSRLDIILNQAFTLSPFGWFVILGRALLVAAAIMALARIYKKFRTEEKEIEKLEEELKETREELLPVEIRLDHKLYQTPQPDEEMHATARHELNIPHPHIVEYIKKARNVGLDDMTIREDLKKAGWGDKDIQRAFNNP